MGWLMPHVISISDCELINLGVIPSKLDQGLFYWLEDGHLATILVCHVDDIFWGSTHRFKTAVIDNLGNVLKFEAEHSSAFTYIGIQLEQHSDFSITLKPRLMLTQC